MASVTSQSTAKPHSLLPPWLKGKWGMAGIFLVVYIFIFLAWTHFHWGGAEYISLIGNLAILPPMLLSTLMAWRVTVQPQLDPRLRRAWFLLGLGSFSVLLGEVIWTYLENVLQVEPFPSIADIFFLGFYPLMLWGFLTLPSAPHRRRERLIFWLDLLSVLTAASMFVGYFLIVPTAAVNNSNLLSQLLATAYPVWSLILLGGAVALLLRSPESKTQSMLLLLLASMAFFLASDLSFGYASLAGTYAVGSWIDTGWHIAQAFVVLAALRQMHTEPVPARDPNWSWIRGKLARLIPRLAILLGYAFVLYVLIVDAGRAAEWLMAGALLLTLLVISRQIVSPAFADLPVRVKVILTFILMSVLSVSLVSATAYLTIRSNLESLAGDSLKEDVELRSQTVGNELSKQLDIMEGFVLGKSIENAANTANAHYTGDQATIVAKLQVQEQAWKTTLDTDPLVQDVLNNSTAEELYEFQHHFPTHTDMLLTDKYGATIAATARPDAYSQATEDWWQAAYNQGQGALYLGQPAFDPDTKSLSIVIAVPVHAHLEPNVIGVMHTTFHIQNILEVLSSSHLNFDLFLPDGKLLTPQGAMRDLDADTVSRLVASQNANSAQLSFEGTLQLVSQSPVASPDLEDAEAFKNLNWTLIAHEAPATVFAPLHSAWRTALLTTLFVLFLTSGVAVVLAQVLIAPISRLTQVAAQIAAGDLTTQAQVESRDEIGALASTFNMMVQELSQIQQELQESEAHYRTLVDYSPDMIAVHRDGKYVFINPAGVKLLGAKSPDELIGRPILDKIPHLDCECEPPGIEETQDLEALTKLLHPTLHRLDGTSFEAEIRAIRISHAGEPALQFVIRDISERKHAEEKIHQLLTQVARQRGELEIRVEQRTAELNTLNLRLQEELSERQRLMQSLQESEQRFRLVFDASPDAIFLLDPHDPTGLWRIVNCNPSACQMNGYTREELIGQSIDILNAVKGGPEGFASTLERLRREVAVRGIEAIHRHKSGHVFPIEYSTSLITIGGRELILGMDRDITDRKQSELALRVAKDAAEESRRVAETANRAKSEFLSRMSHELRTPMNAILGFAQLLSLSHKEPLSSVQNDRVRQIVKAGQHLLDLINEILDISRIEAGRLQISPEPVPVRESIQEALELTVSLAVKRNIQLQSKLAFTTNPYVLADRQRLKQVMLNLLSNAVKYNRDGGFVLVTCEPTQTDGWRISITDTGMGIPAEGLQRLFTPFERLNADQSTVEGTGLGLALAKRLVELMKGRIGVESTLGQGSTFWIELPSAESQLARLQRTGATGELPVLSAADLTILYIEDNLANIELIRQVLGEYAQIKLLWATDPETGMDLARQHLPNLILLDLHLGGRDGTEILQQLKQDDETKYIPVIMVSADATPGPIEQSMALGAHAYLTKPLDVKRFIQQIEELLTKQDAVT